jgi:hypothetical protein
MYVNNNKENDLIGSLEGLGLDIACKDLENCFFGLRWKQQKHKKMEL